MNEYTPINALHAAVYAPPPSCTAVPVVHAAGICFACPHGPWCTEVEACTALRCGAARREPAIVACVRCRYNRLFTLTAQCTAAELPKYQQALKSITASFVPPPKAA